MSYRLVPAVLAVLSVATSSPAQFGDFAKPKHITFKSSVVPDDPFSDLNSANPPANAKLTVQPGETFVLRIEATPEKDWYTYPLTRRAADQPEAQLGKMTLEGGEFLQPIAPVTESDPEWKKSGDEVFLAHPHPFTIRQDVYVKPNASPKQTLTLTVKLKVQVCSNVCVWEDHTLEVPVTVGDGPRVPPTAALERRLAAKPSPPVVVPLPKKNTPTKDTPTQAFPPTGTAQTPTSWWGDVVTAILGGLVSLLTPCVFPMIPITVSYFLKQSETANGAGKGPNAVFQASIYSATIVLVMTLGGMLLMQTLAQISSDYRTNFILGGLFVFFALSLLGMYDITLPSWLQDATSAREGKGGLLGVFFMALTFSIISFTCVGPIYGSFITLKASGGSAAADHLRQFASVFAFSLAFAAPFFLLALFPSLLRTLPRAGSWMNSVKVVMGFLELAAAVKFIRAGEIALTGASTLFTFDFGLGLYVALSFACALYLLGVYRLPHDHDAPETIGVPRFLFSLTFLTLGLYMMPGLFKGADGDSQRPRGEVFAWVEAFLLPETDAKPSGTGGASATAGNKVVWHTKLNEALALAEKENKLVFIDFTGQVCTNCRLNERNVFPRPEVQEALAKHVLLKLYADVPGVPKGVDQQPDADESARLRIDVFKSAALPVYALVKPKGGDQFDIVGIDTQGVIKDVPAFVKFLTR